jgi:hypothetical protein
MLCALVRIICGDLKLLVRRVVTLLSPQVIVAVAVPSLFVSSTALQTYSHYAANNKGHNESLHNIQIFGYTTHGLA